MPALRRTDFVRDERGQTLVLFSVLLPLILILTSITWDAGNWWVKRRHLQTKVDAAALAGGTAWNFPCTPASDTNTNGSGIIDQARKFFGQHITAPNAYVNGVAAPSAAYTGTAYNPQVDGTPYQKIHVVLNGTNWYDSNTSTDPADKSGQTDPTGSICANESLNVKATEQNSDPLFGILPLTPSIKRQATVQIQEAELRGLLPIAVRVPKPVSAAAVFYDETTGNIEAVRYFREICTTTPAVACDASIPPGLGEWTTLDPTGGNWAQFTPSANTGVVIATSFRPACNTGTVPSGVVTGPAPCMEDGGFTTVNGFCDQTSGVVAPVKCEDANGSGASQAVVSGLQFMRSYANSPAVTNGDPKLRTAYLDGATAACDPPTTQSYFNAGTSSCTAILHVKLDLGSVTDPGPPARESRTVANTKVTYRVVSDGSTSGGCNNWTNNGCDLTGSGGPGGLTTWVSGPIQFDPRSHRTSIVLRVRLANTTVAGYPTCQFSNNNPSAQCQFYYTAADNPAEATEPGGNNPDAYALAHPVQRAFMGDINSSGAVKWLRLTADTNCDGVPDLGLAETGEAASVPNGGCSQFYMTMGLQGGLAKDQDEPPIQLNIGATSQSAILDCDPTQPNLKDEVQNGCQTPFYAKNQFNTSPPCPPDSPGTFFNTPKAAPFNPPGNYPPWRCVLTQTSNAANQIEQGLNLRIFGVSNNPACPADNAGAFVKGRNYWHNANNGPGVTGANDNSWADNHTFADDGVDNAVTGTPLLPNRIPNNDPRLVTLFFTPYDSFTGNGNEIFPIVGFGDFYITGYGRLNGNGNWQGGGPEDPCTKGNSDASPGAGNKPPPDLDMSGNGVVAWGHFVKEVVPSPNGLPTGVTCDPVSFDPCIPVLIE